MKKMLLGALLAFAAAFSFGAEKAENKPFDTTVGEFFTNPVGYSLSELSFSWKLPPARQNIRQTAYQIVAAHSPDALETAPLWDSGKVESARSVKVSYGGKPLASRERLYWKVRYWDENGAESAWSEVNFCEAGLLSNSEWRGSWIFSPEPPVKFMRTFVDRSPGIVKKPVPSDYLPPTYLRKEAELAKKPVSARLYVTVRGIFQFYINGKKVGSDFWGTGWTDYNKRIQTNTYDITDMLVQGKNAFAATIGDGWYCGRIGYSRTKPRGYYGKRPELLAQIEVSYKDGSKETIATDASWKRSFGPITFSDIYDGEEYDARLDLGDWKEPVYDDSDWKPAAVNKVEAAPLLEPRRNQPIVQKDFLYPVSVREVSEGTFIFDLGQNMVGWPRIKIPSVGGREIKIRYAEMLNKDGTLYVENYRAAQSTDKYICAGTGTEEWEPTFTYHGFRYVELSGFPKNIKPSLDWVRGIVLYNDMRNTGSFFCSKPKVNTLQNNIRWGQRSNFFSTPTDCPQRDERLGWTGDAQVFIPTAAFNMDVSAFFTKWTLDLADTEVDGCPAHVAPHVDTDRGSPAWSDAIVICPWEIYMAFGDVKILRQNYAAMAGWVDYMARTSKNLIRPAKGYGDWLQPNGKTDSAASDCPKDLIGTAYFVRSADILAKTAAVLGKTDDAKKYTQLADAVRRAFNKEYLSEDGTVKSDCQTAYLLALGFDILPESIREKSFAKLVSAIARDGNRLNTGFVGTPLLNPVLTRFGRMDLAYMLINNEQYPSWIYPINQGATTMWERWNSYSHENGFGSAGMNSFNHYAYGAIGQWMYKDIAGLWYDESNPGYKNIMFEPKLGGGFAFANATHETPYGTAYSSWKVIDGVMEWTVIIPPNATGTITFPTQNVKSIRINGYPVGGRKMITKNGLPCMTDVASGKYEILLRQ